MLFLLPSRDDTFWREGEDTREYAGVVISQELEDVNKVAFINAFKILKKDLISLEALVIESVCSRSMRSWWTVGKKRLVCEGGGEDVVCFLNEWP